MDTEQVKEIIKKELPGILRDDLEMRGWILNISESRFADKEKTEDRIEKLLDELRCDREKQDKKWEKQDKKWEENQKEIRILVEGVEQLSRKHDSTIGALGARWGLNTEESFRNALKGILETDFDVEVLNVNEYDDAGEVFGRPEQVEIDIIIRNGILTVVEIKSSISKAEMYTFFRKAKFYEKRHNRKISRMIVISPMVDSKAMVVANSLGISVYTHAESVDFKVEA